MHIIYSCLKQLYRFLHALKGKLEIYSQRLLYIYPPCSFVIRMLTQLYRFLHALKGKLKNFTLNASYVYGHPIHSFVRSVIVSSSVADSAVSICPQLESCALPSSQSQGQGSFRCVGMQWTCQFYHFYPV